MTELERTLRAMIRDEVRAAVTEAMHSSPAASQRACLTVNEAAELARVTPKTVRKWIAAGELRALKAGRSHRVDRDELVTFMAAGPKPKEADHTPEQLAVIHLRRQSG